MLAASSVLLLASSIPFANGQKYGEDWDYVGEANAANQEGNWGKAAEECDGQMQSPIDITTSAVRPAGLSKPKFSYGKLDENDISGVERSKKSIQFNLNGEAKMSMTLFGRAYELLQFHFHWPSEHTIDGENAESELHLVHQHEDGELAVVSVLIDSKDGLERDSALEQLKDVAVEEDLEDLNLPLKKLLPRPMEFYYYTGPLPPIWRHLRVLTSCFQYRFAHYSSLQ